MFFDPYFLLLIPAMIFAMWAQWKVQHTYAQFQKVGAANGLTGRQMAESILKRNGLDAVVVEEVGGVLSDHYDPRIRKVRLSTHNYHDRSIAAVAVAAHEVGHALQHAQSYAPLAIRSAIAPVAGFGSTLAFPLFLVGFLFGNGSLLWLADLGILLFSGAVIFQIITLPVEFDASKRALAQLTETGAVAPQEVSLAKKVLDAAALTYVAAAAVAAMHLLRMVLLRNSRN
jgi:Zn-dependent membrane protease YugP